jgi:hypothetical protein
MRENQRIMKHMIEAIDNIIEVYGTQLGIDQETGKYFVLPIQDPEEVDKRRLKLGLGPLSEYLKRFGIGN